jgi:signal transduction histidine kinase
MRERFVAVLGHDLRNPLGAINMGTEILKKESLSKKGVATLKIIQRSARRMADLIEDVLDVARVRLGAGLPLVCNDTLLQTDLEQVIEELQGSWPNREIRTDFAISHDVPCNRSRIGQLFSNLVGNALAHGADHSPVHVHAYSRSGIFEFSVANQGDPIPPAVLETLFEPFSRHSNIPQRSGSGLGLYIASEVARAHGGTLDVSTSANETKFWFRMPIPLDGERQF